MNKWKGSNGNKCNMCNSNKKPTLKRSLRRALNIEKDHLERFMKPNLTRISATNNKGRSPNVGPASMFLCLFCLLILETRSALSSYFLYTPPETVPGS